MLRRNQKSGFSIVEMLEGLVAVGLLGGVCALAMILPAMNMASPAPQAGGESGEAIVPPPGAAIDSVRRGNLRPLDDKPTVAVETALAELEGLRGRFDIAFRSVTAAASVTDSDIADLVRVVNLGQAYSGRSVHEKSELVLWDWLRRMESINLVNTNVTDAAIAHLNQVPTLQELYLSGTQITDAGVEQLAAADSIRFLGLCNTQITDRALEAAGRFPELRQLYISDTAVTSTGLAFLGQLEHLQVLELNGTSLKNESAMIIREFKSLRQLSLQGQPITDAAVPFLAKLPQLESLELADTKIGDASADDLKQMFSLTYLDVSGTNYTLSGVNHLAEALFDCDIVDSHR